MMLKNLLSMNDEYFFLNSISSVFFEILKPLNVSAASRVIIDVLIFFFE